MANATLTSSADAAAMDHRNLELLLMVVMMMTHSLLRNKGAAADDYVQLQQMKEMVRALSMAINRRDQSAVSEDLLVITRRLLGEQLRSLGGGENEGRAAVSSAASDHQLMDSAAASKKKATIATTKKKKRNKRNKAAAKHKKSSLMSWLGGGLISLLLMTFGSITTLIALSLIHQSDGSSEGKAPPTLPPSASTSLRQRDLQSSNVASTSPSSVSPLAAVVQSPVFSPAAVSNPPTNSFGESAPTTCLDTPNWVDGYGSGCDWYEENEEPGCPDYGSSFEGNMGVAKDNCCYCGGGSHTLPPTTSPTITSSPTELCFDTPNWVDWYGYGCDYYEENEEPGCPDYGSSFEGNMGVAKDNCCYCGGGSRTLPPTTSPKPSISPTKSATPTAVCFDTPNWKDGYGEGCDWYEENDEPGCFLPCAVPDGGMGVAEDNCCYCGGGSHTLPPTASPTITSSPTKSATPTALCFDTPNWVDCFGFGCDWYEENDEPGCPQFSSWYEGSMGEALDNCCYCGGGSHTRPPTTSLTITSSPTKSTTTSNSPTSTPSSSSTE
jgi:hypothetical protein